MAACGMSAAAADDDPQAEFDAGHYGEAYRLWLPLAEAGVHRAQIGVANLYDIGRGLARDPAAAYRWYRLAAEAGLADAEFNVAVMEDTGDGAPRNTADAALWYGRAAAHDNGRAEYNLAQLYAAGDGVPRNIDAAETWFRAAAAKLPAAADRLAALRRVAQRPPATGQTAPEPAQLAIPADGSTVTALGPAASREIELVWIAPSQPMPVRYFIQILALDAADDHPELHEVFGLYVDGTAALAMVDHAPGRFAWRVYSVSQDLRHYAASPWARFAVQRQD